MANPKEMEQKTNQQKNDQKIKQDVRPEKYSGQRKNERQLAHELDNKGGQKREETDYSATQIKGLD